MKENRYELNKELAQMLKGGVIMDAVSYTHLDVYKRQTTGSSNDSVPTSVTS